MPVGELLPKGEQGAGGVRPPVNLRPGGRLLAGTPFNDVRQWIRHHHERADGTGYPDRLAGESIPLEAQIIGVAEAFEELTSDRPYRAAVSMRDAMDEIRSCAGTQFNPAVVDALSILAERGDLDSAIDAGEGPG